jgi:hypothetical protein
MGRLSGGKVYIGVKVIEAAPMSLGEYNNKYNKVVPITDGEEGYVVMYPDGYISWSPKKVFESAYREILESEAVIVDER